MQLSWGDEPRSGAQDSCARRFQFCCCGTKCVAMYCSCRPRLPLSWFRSAKRFRSRTLCRFSMAISSRTAAPSTNTEPVTWTDPKRSALNEFCHMHDVKNVLSGTDRHSRQRRQESHAHDSRSGLTGDRPYRARNATTSRRSVVQGYSRDRQTELILKLYEVPREAVPSTPNNLR
jgi:hypothetical protein